MEYQDLNNERESLFLGPDTLHVLEISSPEQITIIEWWKPGGAETYTACFSLIDNDGVHRDLIAKACIKLCPRETTQEWLQRRAILSENGVHFPEIYAIEGATLVEEFIPYTFFEAYKTANQKQRSALEECFKNTYLKIIGAGFNPTSLHDLRSHGDDVVVIDVGEDLGPPRPINSCDLSAVLNAEKQFRYITGKL